MERRLALIRAPTEATFVCCFAKEVIMHATSCNCPKCRSARGNAFSARRPAYETLSEEEELELAMELLAIESEAEWEQFLGKFFRKVGRGLKKFGRKVLKPLGRVVKGIAKKALPFVGGALGSFIPIPGVGTAVGSALGGALSKALEMEFGELEREEAELEIARRIVRIAASAARKADAAPSGASPESVLRSALAAAARAHVAAFAANEAELMEQADYEDEENGFQEWEEQGEDESDFAAEAGSGDEWEGESRSRPCSPIASCQRPIGGAPEPGRFSTPARDGSRWYTPMRGDNRWRLARMILDRHLAREGRSAPTPGQIADLSRAIRDHECNGHLRSRMFLPRFKSDRFTCGGPYYGAVFIPFRKPF